MKKKQLRVSASITDFAPLFGRLEYVFAGLKQTGVTGVEIVIGIKSRWSVKKLKKLSEKYELPITSIHQPIWSGIGGYFDEQFFDIAKQLGTKKVVVHPLQRFSFTHPTMQRYLEKLARLQEKKDIEVCLENLQEHYYMLPWANYLLAVDKTTCDMDQLFSIVKHYGFKATLDIDHLHEPAPHTLPWFNENLDLIRNIHLSSFSNSEEHLPLYLGDFHAKEFIKALEKNNYKGNLTFEIYYPHLVNLFSYNFEAIKKSIEFLQK